MKAFASLAALGLIISLATVTSALHDDNKTGSSSEIERSMPVDPKATITICVMSGSIEVRGWDKSEVRVRSADAAVLDFRRIDKAKEKEKAKPEQTPATRVDVMVNDKSDKAGKKGDCQAIADLNVEVPKGATIQVQTRDGDIHIVGVDAAYVGSQNGDITIERVTKIVEAGSVGGSISLHDSAGRINLSTASGTVDVANVRATSSDDTFEVATVSGDVNLTQIGNSKLSVKTVSGAVIMTGALVRSGEYGFTTWSGDVVLAMPTDASFQIIAKLSDAQNIVSDFKLKYLEMPTPPANPRTPGPGAPAPRSPTPKVQPAPKPGAQASTKPPQPGVAAPPTTPPPTAKSGPTAGVVIKPSVVVAPFALRRIVATCGSGDANIAVNSFTGTVRLKKI